jgi:hypothetical protein
LALTLPGRPGLYAPYRGCTCNLAGPFQISGCLDFLYRLFCYLALPLHFGLSRFDCAGLTSESAHPGPICSCNLLHDRAGGRDTDELTDALEITGSLGYLFGNYRSLPDTRKGCLD